MSDTQRSRAQILALFADNVTGQVSAQDLRDFSVTIMEEEFKYAGDMWVEPAVGFTITDKSARGWFLYSQTIKSDCSWMNVLFLNTSGEWHKANVSASAQTGVFGIAMNSYLSNESQAQILMRGLIYDSSFSATFSGFVGKPVYLASTVAGSITITKTTNSVVVLGFVLGSTAGNSNIGKWYFRGAACWAIAGS